MAMARKGPDNRMLRPHEMYLLAAMYWPYDEVGNAVNVAFEESGWETGAWNENGEDSRGLWQLNVEPDANPRLAMYNLFDPQLNAYWAYQLWKERGWQPWYNSAKRLGLI